MDTKTSYQYKASNEDSYNSLAAYVATAPTIAAVTATLHPGLLTIVVSGNYASIVDQFIKNEDLDFQSNPIEVHDENLGDVIDNETTDADTLRKIIYRMMGQKSAMVEHYESAIAEITKDRDTVKKDRDLYIRWYTECNERADRIKGQVQAIALLLNEIYPKE